MSEWISVEDKLPPSAITEVEIAWWDGTLMCRAFGCHDGDLGWYSYGEPMITSEDPKEWRVTHWRLPERLPEPPND